MDSVWINEYYKYIEQVLAQIETEIVFANVLRPSLPDGSLNKESFLYRYKNEFNIYGSGRGRVRLYTKKDVDDYIVALKMQQQEWETRAQFLKNKGAISSFNKEEWLSNKYSESLHKLWSIELEIESMESIKNKLPKSDSSFGNFYDRHENEFDIITKSRRPVILNQNDAIQYIQSLKMQKAEVGAMLKAIENILGIVPGVSGSTEATEYQPGTDSGTPYSEFAAHRDAINAHMATSDNVADRIVRRNQFGDFSAHDISLTGSLHSVGSISSDANIQADEAIISNDAQINNNLFVGNDVNVGNDLTIAGKYTWHYNPYFDSLDLVYYSVSKLYVGLKTSPAKIVELNLYDLSKIRTLTLSSGRNIVVGLARLGNYLYAALCTDPAIVVKIDQNTMSVISEFVNSTSGPAYDLISDGSFLYCSTDGSGILKLDEDLNKITSGGYSRSYKIAQDSLYIYASDAGILTAPENPERPASYDLILSKVRKSDMSTIVTKTPIAPQTSVLCLNGYPYWGMRAYSPEGAGCVMRRSPDTLNYEAEFDYSTIAHDYPEICTDGVCIYAGTKQSPAKIHRMDPNVGNSGIVAGTVTATLTLDSGEDSCNVIVYYGGCLYVGLGTSPAKIVKINSGTMTKVRSITLDVEENGCGSLFVWI